MEKDRGLEKAEGWKIRRLEGWKDRCVAKTRKERGRGFEGSSGSLGNLILKIKKSFESQRGASGERQKIRRLEVSLNI